MISVMLASISSLRNDTHLAQGVFMWNLLFEAAGNNSEFTLTFF